MNSYSANNPGCSTSPPPNCLGGRRRYEFMPFSRASARRETQATSSRSPIPFFTTIIVTLREPPLSRRLSSSSKRAYCTDSLGSLPPPYLSQHHKFVYIDFYLLPEFLRWSFMIFIIQGFRTIVFIFIVIFTTFQPICPPTFFRCFLSNSGAYKELRTTSVIWFTRVACSDSGSNLTAS